MSLVALYKAAASAFAFSNPSTIANYVDVTPTGIQYATTGAPTQTDQLVELRAVCTFNGEKCIFIDPTQPCVITSIDGIPTIMPAKKVTTDPKFKSLNDALLYLKNKMGMGGLLYPSVTLPLPPPSTSAVPPPSTTSAPPPPSTEAPLIQPWQGNDYIAIESNAAAWEQLKNDDRFKPIIVDTLQSNPNKLVYKMYDTACTAFTWDADNCDKLSNTNFQAFKNFKDAFASVASIIPPETTPGGGKRTKKKGKRQTHKKHTRRHRRRAAN